MANTSYFSFDLVEDGATSWGSRFRANWNALDGLIRQLDAPSTSAAMAWGDITGTAKSYFSVVKNSNVQLYGTLDMRVQPVINFQVENVSSLPTTNLALGRVVYYGGDVYVCTDITTPLWVSLARTGGTTAIAFEAPSTYSTFGDSYVNYKKGAVGDIVEFSNSTSYNSGTVTTDSKGSLGYDYTTKTAYVANKRDDSAAKLQFRVKGSASTDTLMSVQADGKHQVKGSGSLTKASTGTFHILTTSAGTPAPNTDADDLVVESSASTGITVFSGATSTGNIFFADPTDADVAKSGQITFNHADNTFYFKGNVGGTDTTWATLSAGGLTVAGTTTTIDSTTLTVDDKNIELGSVASPSDSTADGGGITLKGATDKTIAWTNNTDAWHFNQGINVTSGKVGVGTTSPGDHPDEKNDLVIGDQSGHRGMTIASGGTNIGTIRFAPSTSANAGEGWIDYSNNSKAMRFGTNGLNTRMLIDASGKVGIGTASPGDHPDEKDDLVIGNQSGHRGMTIASGVTSIGTIRFAPSTAANSGEGWIDYSNNTKVMRFGTNGLNTRLTIGSSGDLTIAGKISGVTDPSAAQDAATKAYVDAQATAADLDFQGDSGGALSIDLDSETLTVAGGTGVTTAGSGNQISIATDAAQSHVTSLGTLTALTGGTGDFNWDSNTLVVDSSVNRVGIGTATPGSQLEIEGSSGDLVFEIDNNAANAANFQIQNGAGNSRVDLVMDDGSASTTVTMKGQKVGIMDTSPSYTLDVTGTGQFTSNVIVGGAATVGSIALGASATGRILLGPDDFADTGTGVEPKDMDTSGGVAPYTRMEVSASGSTKKTFVRIPVPAGAVLTKVYLNVQKSNESASTGDMTAAVYRTAASGSQFNSGNGLNDLVSVGALDYKGVFDGSSVTTSSGTSNLADGYYTFFNNSAFSVAQPDLGNSQYIWYLRVEGGVPDTGGIAWDIFGAECQFTYTAINLGG